MSDRLKFALRYAKEGYPVLPVWPLVGKRCMCPKGTLCDTPGKHPIQDRWTELATTDTKRIEHIFQRHTDAHIGIMPPRGCSIIDVDPRNGGDKTLKGLMNGHKLPDTVTQRSGGGGMHLFFTGMPNGTLGKGIDVKRFKRGFVVAAPADHVSGGTYTWKRAPWDSDMADLPECLQGVTVTSPSTSVEKVDVPLERVRKALAHVDANDYQRWVNVGQALRHNYGDEGEEVWTEWSQTSSKWKEGDASKWESFDKNRDRPLITVRSIIALARRNGFRPLTTEFSNTLWVTGDISRYVDTAPAPIQWAFENCIPCGKVTLLAGAGGSSKSFLTITLAMQMAAHVELGVFKPIGEGKVLILTAEEDQNDIHRRVHAIALSRMYNDRQKAAILENVGIVSVRGLDWRLMYHDDSGDLQETERVDYVIDEIKALGNVRMVVFDPLVAFNGADENDNAEMSRLMFTLDRIANETGAAVVMVHHVSKGGQVTSLNDASQAAVRGASALVDNARSAILLTRLPRADAPLYNVAPDDAGRHVVVRFIKNNYGAHMPDMMFVVEAGGALRHAPEVVRVHSTLATAQKIVEETNIEILIANILADHPETSQRDLASQTHRALARIHRTILQMCSDGLLKRQGMGQATEYILTDKGRQKYGVGDDIIGHQNDDIL
jgi:KaiC/GvpD/RAD55 family RecA-like ATPase/predicted transcriptional regulator